MRSLLAGALLALIAVTQAQVLGYAQCMNVFLPWVPSIYLFPKTD
jgi:hypothetical protein